MGHGIQDSRFLALLIAIAFVVIEQYLTFAHIEIVSYFYRLVLVSCFCVGVWMGERANTTIRWTITLIIFYNAMFNAAFGKSYGPYLSAEIIENTLLLWALLSSVYFLPLGRLWRRINLPLVLILFPLITISLGIGMSLLEEQIFIAIYSEGSSPRARWTINVAWLAYDAATDTLTGSD